MTSAHEWRRTWIDGASRLTVEHDAGGRIRLSVDDADRPGFTASFGPTVAAEIVSFIRSEA